MIRRRSALASRLLCLILVTVGLLLEPPPAHAADIPLELRFPGLERGGQVVVALFADEASWRERDNPAASAKVVVRGGAASVRILAPAGSYAVMAFHDRNNDGRLNTLPIGLPTEPYGFSQNARGRFGPPSFQAAAFRLNPPSAVQTIRLR